MALSAEAAIAAIEAAADGGQVDVRAYTRHETRPVPFRQSVGWAREMVASARQLDEVRDDPDGLTVHVVSDGGRLYCFRAALGPGPVDGG
jgi:hypothetical protein